MIVLVHDFALCVVVDEDTQTALNLCAGAV